MTSTAYTLGQIVRHIWPDGVKTKWLDLIQQRPMLGFGSILATPEGKTKIKASGGDSDLARLIGRLPAELPNRNMTLPEQGAFWIGYEQYGAGIADVSRLTPDHLRRAGEALYGSTWQSELARSLNVGARRVREWLAGDRRPSAGVWSDIKALLRQRGDEALAVLVELDRGE